VALSSRHEGFVAGTNEAVERQHPRWPVPGCILVTMTGFMRAGELACGHRTGTI